MKLEKIPFEEFRKYLKLPEKALIFLNAVINLAEEKGFFLYLAGGPVRDFLLKKEVKDLDLVLEGNWEDLLKELLTSCKVTLLFKSQFLTYKIKITEDFTIDLVTARKETYPEPAQLPVVSFSTFKEDVFRRDFTINALIYGLTPPYKEALIDLVSGLSDLKKRVIRPLHLESFVEDPTRAFRGVRYKVRLRFTFAEEFYLALKRAEEASSFKKLSSSRLSNELLLYLFKESFEDLPLLIEEMGKLELLEKAGLNPREVSSQDFKILKLAKEELKRRDLEKFFLLFLVKMDSPNLERLGFPEKERALFHKWWTYFFKDKSFWKLELFEKVELLEKLPPSLIFRLALEEPFRDLVWRFLEEWRYIKPELTGQDLILMGVREGEEVGKILKELRKRKFRGELKNREEEISLVKTLIFQSL